VTALHFYLYLGTIHISMKVCAVLVLALILCSCYHPTTSPLFLYQDNGKTGYIDQQGKIVIPARFAAAQEFSEGLAAVRIGGYYGYIDKSGKTIISAQFDYATGFSHGLALVYKGPIAQYIDKSGHTVSPVFSEGEVFTHGTAIVTNFKGQNGLMDTTGKLLLETIYPYIERVKGGLFRTADSNNKLQLLDRHGKPLPFEKNYAALLPWQDDHLLARLKAPDSLRNDMVILDLSGHEIFRYGSDQINPQYLAEGNIILDSMAHGKASSYMVLYNLLQKTILLNSIDVYTPFNHHRALIRVDDYLLLLVNRDGDFIHVQSQGMLEEGFQFGYAFVTKDHGFGMIDTTGEFVFPQHYGRIVPYGATDSTFLFGEMDDYYGKIGMADRSGKTLLPSVLQRVDPRGFVNGLLQCEKDNVLAYINPSGKVVWQGKKDRKLPRLNIDYMRDNEYYAEDNLGGFISTPFDPIPNDKYFAYPKDIRSLNKQFAKSLLLQVDTIFPTHIDDKYKGYKVQIINNTDSTIQFDLQDFKLFMQMQAFVDNKWVGIERLPMLSCKHPLITVPLRNGEYWELVCPTYEGAQKVRLRMSLRYAISPEVGSGEIFSNEFSGSINPGQLWRTQENKELYRISIHN